MATATAPEAASSSTAPDLLASPRLDPGPIGRDLEPFVCGTEDLVIRTFRDEASDLAGLTRLCEEELSEPYNVYTFRYFLAEWPHLTFFVYPRDSTEAIATIICKLDGHRTTQRGYIGMLSVGSKFRRRGIARRLVEVAVREMERGGAHEVVLETEYDNAPSLALYEALGFLREKRLHRFYSNGKDAFRLILPLPSHPLIARAAALLPLAEGAESDSDDDLVPPEIADVFRGPPLVVDAVGAAVGSLSLDNLGPARPSYII